MPETGHAMPDPRPLALDEYDRATRENDFAAVDLAFPVLEPADEPGAYLFDGSGLTSEANVTFEEGHDFEPSWKSAVHHRRAPSSYLLQRVEHSWDLLAVSTALRDRHFLSAIRQVSGRAEAAAN